MWSEQLDLEAAVASLHVVYPSIAPNAGFRAQLELWQAMGCRVDPQHEAYKRLSLQTLGDSWAEHGSVAQESLPEPEAASLAQVGINRLCMSDWVLPQRTQRSRRVWLIPRPHTSGGVAAHGGKCLVSRHLLPACLCTCTPGSRLCCRQ